MRDFIVTSLWLVLTASVAHGSPVGSCTSFSGTGDIKYLADDRNCSIYYECISTSPTMMVCPNNLHFNMVLKVCDWPAASGCAVTTPAPAKSTVFTRATPSPTTGRPSAEHSLVNAIPETPAKLPVDAVPGKPLKPPVDAIPAEPLEPSEDAIPGKPLEPPVDAVPGKPLKPPVDAIPGKPVKPPVDAIPSKPLDPTECPAIGSCAKYNADDTVSIDLPHAFNCSLFCKCDHGKAVTFECPSGLHFNKIEGLCDWPANANCMPDRGFAATWAPPAYPSKSRDPAEPSRLRRSWSLRFH